MSGLMMSGTGPFGPRDEKYVIDGAPLAVVCLAGLADLGFGLLALGRLLVDVVLQLQSVGVVDVHRRDDSGCR